MHYKETPCGFEWGSAAITRCFDDEKKGWVTLLLETPKYKGSYNLQIYVTKTGKVCIHDRHGEWKPPHRRQRKLKYLCAKINRTQS